MRVFIKSQATHCALVGMFCSRSANRSINHIRKSVLKMAYEVYNLLLNDFLGKAIWSWYI